MSVKEIKAGIAFRQGDTYLFVKERNGKWGIPKGHMETYDKGDPKRTAIREVREETNIIVQYNLQSVVLGQMSLEVQVIG